ncbi:MAG: CDGSH iron-sulfur domain-containing protein [Candidatus Marinimicrobia bacterium]|nr:CDGSH iron-sulfur domain-containing protein [Candidatus Neomarinimicrobiota bacterium]
MKKEKNQPIVVMSEAGKTYAWCSCGLTEKEPFCDGAHKKTDFKPIVLKCTQEKKLAWCGCKHSNNKPYCDGSHSGLL